MVDPNCRPPVIRDRTTYVAGSTGHEPGRCVVKVSTRRPRLPGAGIGGGDVAARALLERGPSVVVLVTDGPRPVTVVTRDGAFGLPVPPVKVVDTVGAGDAFGGAFLARWIERGWGRDDLADRRGPLRRRDPRGRGREPHLPTARRRSRPGAPSSVASG